MSQFSNKDTDIVPVLCFLPIFSGPEVKEYLKMLVPWPTALLFPLTAFSCGVWNLKYIHMHAPTHKANLHPYLFRQPSFMVTPWA